MSYQQWGANHPQQPHWQPPVRRTGVPGWLVVIITVCATAFGLVVGVIGSSADSAATAPHATTPRSSTPKAGTSVDTHQGKANKVTKRQWAKVVKNPDAYVGKRYVIYGQVTQFDSATGTASFRANTAFKDTTEYSYFDGVSTILTGSDEQLSDVVADDVFKATVTVLGSYDYKTQIGGQTVVPHLQIDKITVIGNNG